MQDLGVTFFCRERPLRGANVQQALPLVVFGGIAGPVAIALLYVLVVGLLSRPGAWEIWVVAVLLTKAALVALAIAWVAADSATLVQANSTCGGFSTPPPPGKTSTAHFDYLYGL